MERKHYFGGFELENNFKNLTCRNGKIIPREERCLSYIITKIHFFFSISKNFANDGKSQKLPLFFNKICTFPNRQEPRTILNLLLILVTCWVCLLPETMWGPPPSPPPAAPTASSRQHPPYAKQRMETSEGTRLLGESLPISRRCSPCQPSCR